MLARLDLGLPATGRIGASAPVSYSSRTAYEGQLHLSGADYQSDGEGWADTRQSYSHQGGGDEGKLAPIPQTGCVRPPAQLSTASPAAASPAPSTPLL